MKVLVAVPILFLSVQSCYGNFLNGLFTRPNAVNSNQCQPSGNGSQRIVGGEESPVHYPYQISLQMSSQGEFCALEPYNFLFETFVWF